MESVLNKIVVRQRPSVFAKMFPALSSDAGKHRGVQRHILSFLPSHYRRVARVALRECPPPAALPPMSAVAAELAASPETHALLRYEVEKNGLALDTGLDRLFEENASADIIVWAMMYCDDARLWEEAICRFNRMDVFERLNSHYYMWDERHLCETAWLHDCAEIIGWLHIVRQKSVEFLWAGFNQYAIHFPVRVALTLARACVFPCTRTLSRIFEQIVVSLVNGRFETQVPGIYRRMWSFIESCHGEVDWEPNSPFPSSSTFGAFEKLALEDSPRGRFCSKVLNFLSEHGALKENE